MSSRGTTWVIVPCFNEELRLDGERVLSSPLGGEDYRVLFVDDGSTDGTPRVLAALCRQYPERASWMRLEKNRGKAEAVRRGLLQAVGSGAHAVGYLDADLSTSPEDFVHIVEELVASGAAAALGARVALLGRRIERRRARHLLGRLFATGASVVLGMAVYDTQCGAKVFRVSDALLDAIDEPFHSRWSFDVELIGRLLHTRAGVAPLAPDQVVEVPLRQWIHKSGSKLTPIAMVRSAIELGAIGLHLRARSGVSPRRPPSE